MGYHLGMFNYFFKKPSNTRDWKDDVTIPPTADIQDDSLYIHNVRDFKYRSEEDYDIAYLDKKFNLNELKEVYVGIVHFSKNPYIVHVLLKFVFDNDGLIFSGEVRKVKGQEFIAWKTMLRNYELIYLFGTSSDMIDLRNNYRNNEKVHLHRLNLTKEESKQLLKDLCTRANQLAENPEFFNLITNNCGISVIKHLNKVSPRKLSLLYPFLVTESLDKWIIKNN